LRTIKVESVSIKESKGSDTTEPMVLITTRDKSETVKVRGASLTINRPALKKMELITRLTDKDKTEFFKLTGTKAVEIDKSVAVIDLKGEGYAIYSTTDLNVVDVPLDLRSNLSVKHTAKLSIKDCDKIFKHYGLTFGNSYQFKLDGVEIELPTGIKTLAYILDKPELIKDVKEGEAPVKKVRSPLQLANDIKISQYFADEAAQNRKGTLKAFWEKYPATAKPLTVFRRKR